MKGAGGLRTPSRRAAPTGASRALRRVPGALALLALPLLALLAPSAQANSPDCSGTGTTYQAHEDWALTPSGLDAGDKFRLLFATSGKRKANSITTSQYNTFVRNAAKAGHGQLTNGCANKFNAIISTNLESARENTRTRATDTGASIWWLTGEKVADDYADFYDGTWDSRNAKDESGTKPDSARVWTGSTSSGESHPTFYAGATFFGVIRAGLFTGDPLNQGRTASGALYRLYGLSPVFTVVKAPRLSLSLAKTSGNEGDSNNNQVTVTVELDEARSTDTTFKLCVKNTSTATFRTSTSTNDRDFDLRFNSGNQLTVDASNCHTTTLKKNVRYGYFRILIYGDTRQEAHEKVVLELKSPPSGVKIASSKGTATYTITNDDSEPTVTITGGATASEGTSATFTVKSSHAPAQALSVKVNITEAEDANTGKDHVDADDEGVRTVTVAAGATSQSFTVPTSEDWIDEPDGIITATVQAGTGYVLGTPKSAQVNVEDDDTRGLEFSPTKLNIQEEGSATYTVRLTSQPINVAEDVTVTLTPLGDLAVDTDSKKAGNQTTLTFKAVGVWQARQTVKVMAAEDADSTDDTTTIKHSASGADYGSVAKNLLTSITDIDVPHLVVAPSTLSVTEGGDSTFTVKLATQPSALTSVSYASDNPDLSFNPGSLSFITDGSNTLGWNKPQTVTVSATTDNDIADDAATLTVTASGGDYQGKTASIAATVTDTTVPALVLSTSTLAVTEGASTTYTVALAAKPTGRVTVTIGSNNGDVTVDENRLTFNATGSKLWNDPQTVTVNAGGDADTANEAVKLTHTASGGGYGAVRKTLSGTVTDDGKKTVSFSRGQYSVVEGKGPVTVTLVLSQARNAITNVYVATVGVTATQAVDYTGTSFLATFPAGSTSATIEIPITADNRTEDADGERFNLRIATNGFPGDLKIISSSAAYVTIYDAASLSFTRPQTTTVFEGGRPLEFTLNARAPYFDKADGHGFAHVRLSGRASSYSDYRLEYWYPGLGWSSSTRFIAIPAGTPSARVRITAREDGRTEPNETATLTLIELPKVYRDAGQPFYRAGTPRTVTFTVADREADPPTVVWFNRHDPAASATNAGRVTWRVTFDKPVYDVGVEDFTLTGTTATLEVTRVEGTNAYDVTAAGGNLGRIDRQVEVSFANDQDIVDGSGNALVIPTNRRAAVYHMSSVSPDNPVTLTIVAGAATVEETETAPFTVHAHPVPITTLRVNLVVTQTGDVVRTTSVGTKELKFWAGVSERPYDIRTVDQADAGPGGTVTLALAPGDGYVIGDPSSDTVAVNQTEGVVAPTVALTTRTISTVEGGRVFVVVERNIASSEPLAVQLDVLDDATSDFLSPEREGRRTVTIPASKLDAPQHNVDTTGDATDEPNGKVTYVLVADDAYKVDSASARRTSTIKDDDPTVVTLARTGSGAVAEGGTVELNVTLGRELVAGETIDAPLAIGGTNVTTGDWSLGKKSDATNTGVTLLDAGTTTPKVRFEGAGAQTATLELAATADGTAESSETFTIALGSDSAFDDTALGTNVGGGADPHGTDHTFDVTVNDGAGPPPSTPAVEFASATSSAAEDAGTHNVTLDLAPAAPSGGLDIAYTVTGTATAGSGNDFTIQGSGTLSVAAGATTATIPIAINDDSADDDAETVVLTLTDGTDYTLGATAVHTLTIADNDAPVTPAACVSAALLSDVQGYASETQHGSDHVERWRRVLAAFGESNSYASNPMTASEAQTYADRWTRGRWVPVVTALECLEGTTPPTVPQITVQGGSAVTEGGNAVFTVSASSSPAAALTVTLTVADDASSNFLSASDQGEKTVTIASGQTSATLTVPTQDDSTDEANGSVTATVSDGTGYTVGSPSTATVAVRDNDPTPQGTPVVRIAAGAGVTEGANAEFTLTASPTPTASITVNVAVTQSGAFATSGQTGTRTVTIGSNGTATLTVATDDDGTDEPNGSVTATVQTGTGYTAHTTQNAATVAVADNDVPVVRVTGGTGVTEGTSASFTVTASPTPATDITVNVAIGQSGDFASSGETGTRTVTVPVAGSVTVSVATDDDTTDEPNGTITATVQAGTGYTVATTPNNAATVTVSDDDAAPGAPTLSIADATFSENERLGWFTVRLSKATDQDVRFAYATRDSTPVSARAGQDYQAWERSWRLRTLFNPGETEKLVYVRFHNDSHDEGPETFEMVLFDAEVNAPPDVSVSVAIADGVAVGTITNDDPMPAAWLARFGRTVAEAALDGVADRIAAPRPSGVEGTLAGQALTFDDAAPGDDSQSLERSAQASLHNTGAQAGTGAFGDDDTTLETLTLGEALLGSSFTATSAPDASGGSLALWGRAAHSSFDGREGTFSLDGETTTAMLGADYARGDWLFGMALTQSEGEGAYRDTHVAPRPDSQACPDVAEHVCAGVIAEGDGDVEASLTAAVPYAALEASQRLKLWGALGYGAGEVTLKPAMGGVLSSDITWTMAAAGARSELFGPRGENGGLSIALVSDALWARTSSEKTSDLAASDSDVTRLRLGLEGRWAHTLEGGGHVTPKLEAGMRHDGGDAETGFGVELGGGLAWSHPGAGLDLDIEGRTLIAHDSDDLKDRGFAATLGFDPDPASERGPSFSLGQSFGGQAQGGLDALFTPDPLDKRGGTTSEQRWTAEAAWGFAAFGGRFTGSPHAGVGLTQGARDYTLGYRVVPARDVPALHVSFGVAARRSEGEDDRADHAVSVEFGARW